MDLSTLVRNNIRNLKPYSCARNEFKGDAAAFLDANENPFKSVVNRYPDPLQEALKAKIAQIKKVRPTQIMLGVGSDEPIDFIIRIFCEPRIDNIVTIDPTYSMYEVCANVGDAACRKALLNDDFTLNADRLLQTTDKQTKVVFLCSPNNPTGNSLAGGEVRKVLDNFDGITVVDEAYIDFSKHPSLLNELDAYPRLIVLQTFSKAWGMAAVRCGMAFASETIIGYFNKIKYPYNINLLTQQFVSEQLDREDRKNDWVKTILRQRDILAGQLKTVPSVKEIYPSDANFLLVKMTDANRIYRQLAERGVVVRNRDSVSLCRNCLRITVGTEDENETLIKTLNDIKQ